MKVKYVGIHTEVEVVLPDGRVAVVENGGELDTSPDHAKSLLEQPTNWEKTEDKAAKTAKAADKKEG